MFLQSLIVALLVVGCAAFAAWSLLPALARRTLAVFALQSPVSLPGPIARFMRRHAEASNACGCDGCDRSELKKPEPGPSVVHFHRPKVKGPTSR